MNVLSKALIALGALVILGTAGSSDLDTISFAQILIQCGIGMAMCGCGYLARR